MSKDDTQREKAWAAVCKSHKAHRKARNKAKSARHTEHEKSEELRRRQSVYLVACGWEKVSLYRGSRHWTRMFESYFKRPKGSTYHSLTGALERQRVISNKQAKKPKG